MNRAITVVVLTAARPSWQIFRPHEPIMSPSQIIAVRALRATVGCCGQLTKCDINRCSPRCDYLEAPQARQALDLGA